MPVEMCFNELSACHETTSVNSARAAMEEFTSTISQAIKCGCKSVLRTKSDFGAMRLAEGYFLHHWRNDREVNRDTRTLINSLSLKEPYIVGLDREHLERLHGCEGRCESEE